MYILYTVLIENNGIEFTVCILHDSWVNNLPTPEISIGTERSGL